MSAADGAERVEQADDGFRTLARRLVHALGTAPAGLDFDALALEVFRWQVAHNPTYRTYCQRRGVEAERVASWEEIPPVPTTAFKHLSLVSGDAGAVERVFRTSGTTQGGERRGEHPVRSLALYRAAALPWFRRHVLPDAARLPLVSLLPSSAEAPDSSLSTMMGFVAEELASEAGWFVSASGDLAEGALGERLARAEADGEAVLVAGTGFALVHWMDALDRGGRRFHLADGSRVMETGGFKGRTRTLTREELRAALAERLGMPPGRVVNEYGMTELLSQFYEPTLAEGLTEGLAEGLREEPGRPWRLVAPPWVRTRVLDPATLAPLPAGREGLLCHFDLANAGTVCAILTEDVGVAVGDGFRVLGRTPGAEPRGCSLAMDELLSAARDRR